MHVTLCGKKILDYQPEPLINPILIVSRLMRFSCIFNADDYLVMIICVSTISNLVSAC